MHRRPGSSPGRWLVGDRDSSPTSVRNRWTRHVGARIVLARLPLPAGPMRATVLISLVTLSGCASSSAVPGHATPTETVRIEGARAARQRSAHPVPRLRRLAGRSERRNVRDTPLDVHSSAAGQVGNRDGSHNRGGEWATGCLLRRVRSMCVEGCAQIASRRPAQGATAAVRRSAVPRESKRGYVVRMANIIVIDDNDAARGTMRRTLERDGHQVFVASDGDAGLKSLTETGARLVITDIFMPGQDGIVTLRRIRKEFPGVRVIAVSGGDATGRIDLRRDAELLGAARTLRKPFAPAELRRAVEETLALDSETPS